MARMSLRINGRRHTVDADPDMPLLWVLRDLLGMTGTKYGCGVSECGACTVLLDGRAITSCVVPVSGAADGEITTIEGLSPDGSHPLQQAWIAEEAPQCGYCQTGMIMSAAALLKATPKPTDRQIDEAMAGNICRCGTYDRVRKAIHRAARVGR